MKKISVWGLQVLGSLFLLIFGSFLPCQALAQTSIPISNINAVSSAVINGKLRETAISGNIVWWRDSTDSSDYNLPQTWQTSSLNLVWPNSVWPLNGLPLPVDGNIDAYAFQQFPTCVNNANILVEIVIKDGNLWYRKSTQAGNGDIGNLRFIQTTLTAAWGNAGPPTDKIDSLHYDVFQGNPRELVQRGNQAWVRTMDCQTGSWGTWKIVTLASAWGTTLDHPPTDGIFDFYGALYTASDNGIEFIIKNDTVWSRRSSSPDLGNLTDVWRITTVGEFFSRNNAYLGKTDIAQRFIGQFLNKYGQTDFNLLVNDPYNERDDEGYHQGVHDGFRGYISQGLAQGVNFLLTGNSQSLSQARKIIQEMIANYPKWGGRTIHAPVAMRDLLFSSWIIWDRLSLDLKNQLLQITEQEMDLWTNNFLEAKSGGPYLQMMTGYIDDTKGETNGAIAETFAFAANTFADHPKAAEWDKLARCFSFHTITTGETACGVTTQTVYGDYTLDNHNYHPSPLYTLAVLATLQQGSLAYELTNRSLPIEFTHNARPVWQNFFTYFHRGDYTIYPQFYRGLDWGDIDVWLAMTDLNYLAAVSNSSHLSSIEVGSLSQDILHYFYTYKGRQLRFSNNDPIASLGNYLEDPNAGIWFLNSLIHAKGSAELAVQENMQSMFCLNNQIDKLGRPNFRCDEGTGKNDSQFKNWYLRSWVNNWGGNRHPDVNFDSEVNSLDFAEILNF